MGKVHDRILALAVTADEGDDTLVVSGATYYRTRQDYTDGSGFTMEITAGAAAASTEIEMGELLPPPTHIVLVSTFQA